MQIKKQQLEPDIEQQAGSKLGKEYIKQNVGLCEAQAEFKVARRNINILRYADDTTLMTKNKEELKSLLMKVKEESGKKKKKN